MRTSSSGSPSPKNRGYKSGSASPKSKPFDNYVLNRIYNNKIVKILGFKLLVFLSIIFLIVSLTYLLVDVKPKTCECEANKFFNGEKCEAEPDLESIEISESQKENIRNNLGKFTKLEEFKNLIHDENFTDTIYKYLINEPFSKDEVEYQYYVDTTDTIHSCFEKEDNFCYEITVIILFVICCFLAAISFYGQNY